MNLRDQFLKAGLVDKKRADAVARESKKEQKIAQGNAVDKATLARNEADARAADEARRHAELVGKRREAEARETERAAREGKLLSTRQILRSHRIPVRGGTQKFWYRSPDGREAWRIQVSEWIATDLRCGRLCLAWCDDANPEVVVIDPIVANRVELLRPELILFRNRGPIDTDPSQQLYDEALDNDAARGQFFTRRR